MEQSGMQFLALLSVLTALLFFGLYLSRPSEKSVERCELTTGYSKERCIYEISR